MEVVLTRCSLLAFISVKEDVSTFQPNIALDRHCRPLFDSTIFVAFPGMESAPECLAMLALCDDTLIQETPASFTYI